MYYALVGCRSYRNNMHQLKAKYLDGDRLPINLAPTPSLIEAVIKGISLGCAVLQIVFHFFTPALLSLASSSAP